MKVLITGITGLIGSHLAKHLILNKGYYVFGLKRWRSDIRNISDIENKIKLIESDIEDEGAVSQIISRIKPNYIIHLAAQSYPSESWQAPIATFNANVIGTINILESAIKLKDKPKVFIACSSAEYGQIKESDCPIKETHPLNPLSPYGVSKVTQELLGKQYFYSYKLPVYLGRFFNQIGPGQNDRCSIQTFCKQIAEIEKGLKKPILSVGNLKTRRDFLDVKDGLQGLLKIMYNGTPAEPYNICSGETYLLNNLLNKIIKKTEKKIRVKIDKKRLRPIDEPIIQGDNLKLRRLGWINKIKIDDTIQEVLNYWRSN